MGLPQPDEKSFRRVMGYFATGVAVVTALDGETPCGFTCQSVVSLSLAPRFVALAPGKSSTSWPRIARAGYFCVNILEEHQSEVARRFSMRGGDKFSGFHWRAEVTGAPVLDDALAWVDCRLELVHDAGDHELVVGRALQVGTPGKGLRPLLYYRGRYHGIGGELPSPGRARDREAP